MINSNIGYIICESSYESSETKATPKTINGKVIAEARLQTANEKNRNGRYYDLEELASQIKAPRTVELLNTGYLRAEDGHPLSKDLQRQSTIDNTKTCARFLEVHMDGLDVMAHAVGTNNDYGRAFDLDLKEGCLPAWSLRALGSVRQSNKGLEVHNLRLITWDAVIFPSHKNAYTLGLVTESANVSVEESTNTNRIPSTVMNESGILIPITNESVIKYLQSESSNLKFVRECFDFAYDSIQVNESGSKVILTTNEGETVVINMESYIHNELMNYATGVNEEFREKVDNSTPRNFSIFDMK